MKYYLFLKKEDELSVYKKRFFQVKENINQGKTPVYSELRNAKTIMFECFPYQTLSGFFLILGTILLNKIVINETMKIAIILVVNKMCYATANYIFTLAKHRLRIRLCSRLDIEPNEKNIAVMESLEYQTV